MRVFGAVVSAVVVIGGGAGVAALPAFEPAQAELFAAGNSFTNAWADFNGDGRPDLFVGFNGTPNRLYSNKGGVLEDVASAAGVADARATRAAAWSDYDSDGDADLLVGFTPGAGGVLRLYRNNGAARFDDVTQASGLVVDSGAVRQMSWIDFDADRDPDLFVAYRDRANALYRNTSGVFRNVAADVGLADARKTVGAVWLDYDADGDLDVVVGNMDGDANGVFRNDGGHFTDVARDLGLEWGGRAPALATNGTVRPCAADVDNDGRLDLFFANYGPNGLFLNRGNGRFDDVSSAWGIAIEGRYDACAFADIDNDGRLDMYVNGTITGGQNHPDYIFRNDGTKLIDETPANVRALQADHGVQWADFDTDGDPDLALTGASAAGMHTLLQNRLAPAAAARGLHVRVVNAAGAPVAGAEIRVYRAGTRTLLGMRLTDTGSGYNSQNMLPAHFAIPARTRIDVEVRRPGASVSTVKNVDPRAQSGRVLTVR